MIDEQRIWRVIMEVVEGRYNSAKVFTNVLDENCIDQIKGLLDLEAFREA